jgi:hypothetical protein
MMGRDSRHYEEVLTSDRWRVVRTEAIRRAGYRCSVCGRGGRLDVHHARGYGNLGYERPEELQALCRTCHDAVHTQRQLVNAGCLKVLLWVVVIAIVLQAMSWLMASMLHGVGVS